MKFLSLCQLALAALAVAAPTEQPATGPEAALLKARQSGLSDADILNFALTLEHLELSFYREGLGKFQQSDFVGAGYAPSVYFNLFEVASDEANHVTFLRGALAKAGYKSVPKCQYDFGFTDVTSFVQLAGILEGVGVTAYLGAAHLISNPDYITAAGSILTIEARHSAFIRGSMLPAQSPFAYPFDVPQDPTAVYSLASQFITKCPPQANLGITPFPVLTLANEQPPPVHEGRKINVLIEKGLGVKAVPGTTNAFFAGNKGFILAETSVLKGGHQIIIIVPKGIAGQSYVSLANASSPTDVSDSNIVAGPAIVQVQAPYTYVHHGK